MASPRGFFDRLKYTIWFFYTPLHTYVRDCVVTLRLVRHEGRQQFLLGTIAPSVTAREVIEFLVNEGYGKHFVAWRDEDELISLRRSDDFKRQYHIRIFIDGEVRGHYEYTPECRPWKHLRAIAQEPKREEFLALLGPFIVPV